MLSKLAYAVMVSEYVPAVPYLPEIISCPPPGPGSAGGDDGNIGGGSGGGNNSGGGSEDGPLIPLCSEIIELVCGDVDPVDCTRWGVDIFCIP